MPALIGCKLLFAEIARKRLFACVTSLVYLSCSALSKFFVTEATRIWLLSSVDSFMPYQVLVDSKFLFTKAALVCLISVIFLVALSVTPFMNLLALIGCKLLVTKTTLKWCLACVKSLVYLSCKAFSKFFVTEATWIWLLSSVNSCFVLPHVSISSKLLFTKIAWKWFLPCVNSLMFVSVRVVSKCFVTKATCEWPFTTVGFFMTILCAIGSKFLST